MQDVTDATFDTEVLGSELPVVVDFWAPWCHPCKAMAPILEEMAGEHADTARFVKVDADQNPALAARYGVTGLPTVNVYVGGELVKSLTGGRTKKALQKELSEHLS